MGIEERLSALEKALASLEERHQKLKKRMADDLYRMRLDLPIVHPANRPPPKKIPPFPDALREIGMKSPRQRMNGKVKIRKNDHRYVSLGEDLDQ